MIPTEQGQGCMKMKGESSAQRSDGSGIGRGLGRKICLQRPVGMKSASQEEEESKNPGSRGGKAKEGTSG